MKFIEITRDGQQDFVDIEQIVYVHFREHPTTSRGGSGWITLKNIPATLNFNESSAEIISRLKAAGAEIFS